MPSQPLSHDMVGLLDGRGWWSSKTIDPGRVVLPILSGRPVLAAGGNTEPTTTGATHGLPSTGPSGLESGDLPTWLGTYLPELLEQRGRYWPHAFADLRRTHHPWGGKKEGGVPHTTQALFSLVPWRWTSGKEDRQWWFDMPATGRCVHVDEPGY